MMTLCRTGRGRIACGLGGLTIVLLALGCLWAFSTAVTAGDDLLKKDAKVPDCPLPPMPTLPKAPLPPLAPAPAVPTITPPLPPVAPAAADTHALPKPAAHSDPAPEPPLPKPPVSNAVAPLAAPPPASSDLPPSPQAPPPPLATGAAKEPSQESPPRPPPAEGQDIKQLLARLAEIKSERAKLDDRERQTIQAVKRKYQEQKHALEQLERELRQLGINCEDGTPSRGERNE